MGKGKKETKPLNERAAEPGSMLYACMTAADSGASAFVCFRDLVAMYGVHCTLWTGEVLPSILHTMQQHASSHLIVLILS